MCKVIIAGNQKGGVAKTTTVANLGIGLARHGKRVLLIDGDAQGSLTASLTTLREPFAASNAERCCAAETDSICRKFSTANAATRTRRAQPSAPNATAT